MSPEEVPPNDVPLVSIECDLTTTTTVASSDTNLDIHQESQIASRRRVYRHKTNFPISNVAWLNKQGESHQLALGSLMKHKTNYVQIVRLDKDDNNNQEIRRVSKFIHRLPPTKLLWMPQSENYGLAPFHSQFGGPKSSLLATTSDHLRLWRVQNQPKLTQSTSQDDPTDKGYFGRYKPVRQTSSEVNVNLECVLKANPELNLLNPVLSFDWNDVDPRLIITASHDTTCTLWNIEYEKPVVTFKSDDFQKEERLATGKVIKRFGANEKPVYGVSFSRFGSGKDVFVSAGGDRSLRSFDLRSSRTLILYENEDIEKKALVRVSCSKHNANLLSFFTIESNEVKIMDIRKPCEIICSLSAHSEYVNCMSWAPNSDHLTTASDDRQTLIWNLDAQTGSYERPILAYGAEYCINAMSWSASSPDWIAIAHENCLELLRV